MSSAHVLGAMLTLCVVPGALTISFIYVMEFYFLIYLTQPFILR